MSYLQADKTYEYWYEVLLDPNVGDKEYPGLLAKAYSKLHGQPNSDLAKTNIKAIYDDFYHDPYFLLTILNQTKDLNFKTENDRLDYIKAFATKKMGRGQ